MRKRYRKAAVGLLWIFLAAGMLFGCGREGDNENTGESVSGAVLSGSDERTWEEEISQNSSGEEADETQKQNLFTFKDVYGVTYEVLLNEEALLHDYHMEYLHSDGIFKTYDEPGYTSRVGVDVSKFQGDIDWQKVKDAGIEFAFIRVGNRGYGSEGTLNADGKYRQNIEGAKAAGIPAGVYFYSQAVNEQEAVEEAEYLLGLIEGIELEYPVVYDAEYVIEDEARTDHVTAEQFTANTIAFCERIEEAGYAPVIYATMKWEAYALELEKVNDYPKWYADYEEFPQTPYDFTYWQYTNEAEVDGILGPVDLNLEIIPIEERTEEILETMTKEEKVAQLFVITPEALTGVDSVQSAGNATKEALEKYPVGGLVYFGGNLISPEQTKTMLKDTMVLAGNITEIPLFLAVDEEGGSVARIANNPDMGVDNVGNMSEIGAAKDVNGAYEAGNTIGKYLKDFGFNLDFAPDADVLTNPGNTVVVKRSFGSDSALVSEMSCMYLKGLEENDVMGVLKHFPGHGATLGDTHDGYAYTDKTYKELLEEDLVPFAEGAKNQVPMIMAGHIAVPSVTNDQLPASLSPVMLDDILREDLGYEGVVITDALNMGAVSNLYGSDEACVMAFKAGADMLLMPKDFQTAYEGVLLAVENGDISEERLDESVRRIIRVKLQYLY